MQERGIVFTPSRSIPAATAAAPTATASVTRTIATRSGRNKNSLIATLFKKAEAKAQEKGNVAADTRTSEDSSDSLDDFIIEDSVLEKDGGEIVLRPADPFGDPAIRYLPKELLRAYIWIRLFAISFLVTEAKSTPFDSKKYENNV